MKKKPYKYLKLYHEWMESGFMPENGLCEIFYKCRIFELMKPTDSDFIELEKDGWATVFWGKGENPDQYSGGKLSPLRQNIVLLMAAMNGEL